MRVSVVTPFFNTAPYLEECIESVLRQSLSDFEYLLVDNQSTDGSHDIAERYAKEDDRIRLLTNPVHVGQVDNYNGALAQISTSTEWVKLIQADDILYPECLDQMVRVGERSSRIGLVGALYMKGDQPRGGGLPYGAEQLDGREVCRRMLLEDCFPVGSPSAVLYRADLVRKRSPFFALDRYHEDTEAAYELLLDHDFGFVHQVLTFLRTENGSIMSAARAFNPEPLDHLLALERYGPAVLTPQEYERQHQNEWRAYMGFLGESVLRRRGRDFWTYHREGLAQNGHPLKTRQLAPSALRAAAHVALLPLSTVSHWQSEGRGARTLGPDDRRLALRPRSTTDPPSLVPEADGRVTMNVARPRVSVVVPTRDRAHYIVSCVSSVLANPELLELIVVDQSDDDSTKLVVAGFAEPRLRYVRSEQRGVTNGRNLGMELSTGDVIVFTDDDCQVPPDWVTRIADLFERDPDAAVVCGRVLIPSDQGEGFTTSFEPVQREWQGDYPPHDRDWGITANFAMRRSVLERIGPFDPVLGAGAPLRSGGEPDFIFRTLRAGFKVVNASEVEVTHLHARASGEDSKKLLTNYAYGTAAAFLKHARLGDVRAATIYARHLIGCAKLVLINAATLHRPMGIGYTLAFLRGSLESFKYRIDRQRRIYVRG